MIAAAALGDVVQQHRHIERAARLQMIDQPGRDRRDLLQFAALQHVEHADRFDRVLVDREHVIGVELHLPDDARPVGQQAAEQAGFVQHREPARPVGAARSAAEGRRCAAGQQVEKQIRGSPVLAQRAGGALVANQPAHRQRMQFQATIAGNLQDAQGLQRLGLELAALRRQQHAVGEYEARRGDRLVRAFRHRRRAERRANQHRFQDPREPQHLARGQKIVPHEPLDPVLAAVARVAHARADHRLEVESQPLLGAVGDVVQVKAESPEEIPGAAAEPGLALADQPAGRGVPPEQIGDAADVERGAPDPVKGLQVAQPAAAFLDVRFDEERAVAVALMTRRALMLLGGDEVADPGMAKILAELPDELGAERFVAGEPPRIEQRGADRGVARRLGQALLDRARRVPDLQTEIPQQIEHDLDRPERGRRGIGAGQEQQVDVAERGQHAAPVAAGREQRERLAPATRVGGAQAVVVDRGEQAVGERGEPLRRGHAAQGAFLERLAHAGLNPREVAAERVERRRTRWQWRRRGAVRDRNAAQVFGEFGGGGFGGLRQGLRRQHARLRIPGPWVCSGNKDLRRYSVSRAALGVKSSRSSAAIAATRQACSGPGSAASSAPGST